MAFENFSTGWTETDPNNHLSQTTTRSTFTGLHLAEDAWLDRDSAISFTGDWDVAFDFYVDSDSLDISGLGTEIFEPALVNFNDGGVNNALVAAFNWGDSKVLINFALFEESGFTYDSDYDNTTLSLDTTYYARYRRDETVGTNGTLYLDVYGSSANRNNDTSPLVELETAITVAGKVDMTVAQAPLADDFGAAQVEITGYLENLDLSYVPATTTSTTSTTSTSTTSTSTTSTTSTSTTSTTSTSTTSTSSTTTTLPFVADFYDETYYYKFYDETNEYKFDDETSNYKFQEEEN